MKFEWKIAKLLKKTTGDIPGLVVEVQWHVIGTDENGKSGWFAGAFTTGAPDKNNFTKFEDLTKDQVLGWVREYIDNHEIYRMAHIEEQIRLQIKSQDVELVSKDDLPWVVRP